MINIKKFVYGMIIGLLGFTTIVFAAPTFSFQRNIYPETTNTYSLGTPSDIWANGYFQDITINGTCTGSGCGTGGGGGGGGGADGNWTFFNGSGIKLATTSNQVIIGATATSTLSNPFAKLSVTGDSLFAGAATSTGILSSYKEVRAPFFTATSTTATSTFLGNVMIGNAANNGMLWNQGFLGVNKAPFQVSYNYGDSVGPVISNTYPANGPYAAYAGTSLTFTNGNTPNGGGLGSTNYFAAIDFAGPKFSAYPGLQPNGLGIESTDGGIVLAAASSNPASSTIAFGVGPGFAASNYDVVFKGNSNGYAYVGISSTTPWGRLSVAHISTDTSPSFVISTSTASATTTAFVIDNNGKVGIGTASPAIALDVYGDIRDRSLINATCVKTDANGQFGATSCGSGGGGSSANSKWATSTDNVSIYPNGGISTKVGIGTTTPGTLLSLGNTGADTINISPTATSTFGSGINILTGCFSVNGTCVGGSGGGGSGTINSGTINNLPYYTGATTLSTTGFLTVNNASSFLGIGTTTPSQLLDINGNARIENQGGLILSELRANGDLGVTLIASSTLTANQNIYIEDQSATSSQAWTLKKVGTSFYLQTSDDTDAVSTTTWNNNQEVRGDFTAGSAYVGVPTLGPNGGVLTGLDFTLTSGPTVGTPEGICLGFCSYSSATSSLTLFGSHSGASAGVTNFGVGIGSSTPYAKLSIQNDVTDTLPLFVIASSSNTVATTTLFMVDDTGNLYASSTAPVLTNATWAVVGDNTHGTINASASPATVTFANGGYIGVPTCVISEQTASLVNALSYTTTATVLTITQTSLTGNIDYICIGHAK